MSASALHAKAVKVLQSRTRTVWMMVGACLLWSMAGVVTRHLQTTRPFEITFWRSLGNGLTMTILLLSTESLATRCTQLRQGGRSLWLSAVCWGTMFTAFMLALTLTQVANVLILMALGPLFTALLAYKFLRQPVPFRAWLAIAVAAIGIGWIYGGRLSAGQWRDLLGMAVALWVPLASAGMWVLLQRGDRQPSQPTDMRLAIWMGAWLSALLTLPWAYPFSAAWHDIGYLLFLGCFQLAVPCVMALHAAKALRAPEASLLGLLEILFGISWTWMAHLETSSAAVVWGGVLVIAALVLNECLALRNSSLSQATVVEGAR